MDKSKPKPPAGPNESPDSLSPPVGPGKGKATGRVKFDDRGNAVWEWSLSTGAYGLDVSNGRLKKLENPALAIADEASVDGVRPNPLGIKKGYDPYDSGKVSRAAAAKPGEKRKRKDLRKLGEWIAMRRQFTGKKDDDAT